jgi:hypothetical protein
VIGRKYPLFGGGFWRQGPVALAYHLQAIGELIAIDLIRPLPTLGAEPLGQWNWAESSSKPETGRVLWIAGLC